MSKRSKIHCTNVLCIEWYACRRCRRFYSCEDAESESVELHALELQVLFVAIWTAVLVLKILGGRQLKPILHIFSGGWDEVTVLAALADGCGGGGWLNPNLSLFAGGWDVVVVCADVFGVEEVEDAVAVLVDGCGTGVEGVEDSLPGGRGTFRG